MKVELKKHLIPLCIIFILTSIIWIFNKVVYYQYFYLFLGLSFGSFFLDIDHILYWLVLNPNLEESKLAKVIIKKRDYKNLLKLLESTHKSHTSLIFHHSTSQIILGLTSLFIFTSSDNIFAISFLLALNLHLLIDEAEVLFNKNDSNSSLAHLQDWLFARLPAQLPLKYLKHYVSFFLALNLAFLLLLVKSAT
ncbi:hypothetical protein KKA02_03980 [Patescibacteria group bacterium]|nr:hypothetical protein [Patescibacteria group bacterium]